MVSKPDFLKRGTTKTHEKFHYKLQSCVGQIELNDEIRSVKEATSVLVCR